MRTNNQHMAFENFIVYTLKQNKFSHKYLRTDKNGETSFTTMLEWAISHEVGHGNYAGLYTDTTDIYKKFSMFVDGNENMEFKNLNGEFKKVGEKGSIAIDKLIDYLDNYFTGGLMQEEYKVALKAHLLETYYSKNWLKLQARNIVDSTIRAIIMSPSYMVLK